jgi:hypothetical protein
MQPLQIIGKTDSISNFAAEDIVIIVLNPGRRSQVQGYLNIVHG